MHVCLNAAEYQEILTSIPKSLNMSQYLAKIILTHVRLNRQLNKQNPKPRIKWIVYNTDTSLKNTAM